MGGMETLVTDIQATARKKADFRNEIIAEYLEKEKKKLVKSSFK